MSKRTPRVREFSGKYFDCTNCGTKFYLHPYEIRKKVNLGRFCCKACLYIFRKGRKTKPCTEERREKVRQSQRKGTFKPCRFCQVEFWVPPHKTKQGIGIYCSINCYRNDVPKSHDKRKKIDPNPDGYTRIQKKIGDGWVTFLEHRYISELYLGEPLRERVVHHINEIRSDNRRENLYIFANNADHISYHFAVRRGDRKPITESNLPLINSLIHS